MSDWGYTVSNNPDWKDTPPEARAIVYTATIITLVFFGAIMITWWLA